MIDIGKILKRSWHILWDYKVLWIFGVILALTAGGANGPRNPGNGGGGSDGSNGSGNGSSYQMDTPFIRELNEWGEQNIEPLVRDPDKFLSTLIWIGVGLFLFILLVSAIAAVFRYVSETAVIRMVDEYEQTGAKVGFKQGWRYGWNRTAWRLFLINLVINLPVIGLLLLLIILGLGVYYSVISHVEWLTVTGIIASVGLAFLFIFLVGLGMIVLNWLRHFVWRVCVLEDLDVRDSFKRGFALVKRNWQSAALMWLVMFGLMIAYGIASIILFFILLPVFAVMAIAGLIVAAIPGLIAFGIASLFTAWPLAVIIGVLVALPFFITVTFSPLVLIGGWVQVYTSSVWTLTYREIKALNHMEPVEEKPLLTK